MIWGKVIYLFRKLSLWYVLVQNILLTSRNVHRFLTIKSCWNGVTATSSSLRGYEYPGPLQLQFSWQKKKGGMWLTKTISGGVKYNPYSSAAEVYGRVLHVMDSNTDGQTYKCYYFHSSKQDTRKWRLAGRKLNPERQAIGPKREANERKKTGRPDAEAEYSELNTAFQTVVLILTTW